MRNNLLAFIIISLFSIESTTGQSDKVIAIFKNETYVFNFIKTSTRLLDSNIVDPSVTLITSKVSYSDRKKIKKLKYKDWMNLLSSDATDWAANLYLYETYKKEASTFEVVRNKENWRKCCKEGDIAFWRKELSTLR